MASLVAASVWVHHPKRNPCKTNTRNPDKEGQRLIDRIPIPNALPAYLIGGSHDTAICDTTAACLDQC